MNLFIKDFFELRIVLKVLSESLTKLEILKKNFTTFFTLALYYHSFGIILKQLDKVLKRLLFLIQSLELLYLFVIKKPINKAQNCYK